MIWLNLGTWLESYKTYFVYKRIYLKGYIWTPFVRVSRRVYKPDNSAPAPDVPGYDVTLGRKNGDKS